MVASSFYESADHAGGTLYDVGGCAVGSLIVQLTAMALSVCLARYLCIGALPGISLCRSTSPGRKIPLRRSLWFQAPSCVLLTGNDVPSRPTRSMPEPLPVLRPGHTRNGLHHPHCPDKKAKSQTITAVDPTWHRLVVRLQNGSAALTSRGLSQTTYTSIVANIETASIIFTKKAEKFV